jgi:hypothetical protein
MSSIATRRYISIDVGNLRGGYPKPSIVTTRIPNHRNGHSMKLNRVVLKYVDFKKDVDPYVHVKVFNSIVKENAKTSK